jgi:DNA segregation ATPase FtsK/SpoIIIE, S-DNA-T family
VRLWLGEPATVGSPVEVLLRRQEGANLIVVAAGDVDGPGVLLGALATALIGHGPALEAWVLDLGPLEGGFGQALPALDGLGPMHVARRRTAERLLGEVGERVASRHEGEVFDAPPCLLVVNGLGRARWLDAGAGAPGPEREAADVLATILRDGPEVGVHTLAWCDSVDLLDRRLGREALVDFGACVATTMDEQDSTTLLDSAYASTLRPRHALLADEERGRLVKFRPYVLPPSDWHLPEELTPGG